MLLARVAGAAAPPEPSHRYAAEKELPLSHGTAPMPRSTWRKLTLRSARLRGHPPADHLSASPRACRSLRSYSGDRRAVVPPSRSSSTLGTGLARCSTDE